MAADINCVCVCLHDLCLCVCVCVCVCEHIHDNPLIPSVHPQCKMTCNLEILLLVHVPRTLQMQ